MKQITFRLPESLYRELSERGEKIGVSTNSMILFLVHMGLKIFDGEAVIQQTPAEAK